MKRVLASVRARLQNAIGVERALDARLSPFERKVEESVEQIDSRLTQMHLRMERHLGVIEDQVAKRLAAKEPGFERFFERARPVVTGARTLLGYDRLWVLWQAARNVAPLRLPAAEVGTYRGGSAWFLASAFREFAGEEIEFRVIDTFEGHLAETLTERDSMHHRPGLFADVDYDEVVAYLAPFERVHVYRGNALDVFGELDLERFALAHVDVDLYMPTLRSLEFFGERLAAGGVLVVDDYGAPKCPGVKDAVDEFTESQPSFQRWDFGTEQAVLVRSAVGVVRGDHRQTGVRSGHG